MMSLIKIAHVNYIGTNAKDTPVIVSILLPQESDSFYSAIVRSVKTGK